MGWHRGGLNRKFALGTAAGLLASSLAFLVVFAGLYRAEMEHERANAAGQVARLLQTSLENAMLKRDLEGLRDIVTRLGATPGVVGVRIMAPNGEVRFASDPAWLGSYVPIPEVDPDLPTTEMVETEAGGLLLRTVNPVANKAPCQECHGPLENHPVNGILYVDFDGEPIRDQAWRTTLLLSGSGALVVLINLAGGWWFMGRYVTRPARQLTAVSARLGSGDLEARAFLEGNDELADLGRGFNHMAEALRDKIEELADKERFLEQLLDAIPDGVRVVGADYKVVLSNTAFRRQVGLRDDETMPGTCYAATHGRDAPCPEFLVTCPLVEMAKGSGPLRFVHRRPRRDGGTLDAEVYAAPMQVTRGGVTRAYVVESIRDLAQEVRFSHEQKLSELGRLAAGVAHEIYNPLTSVRMALHAALQALGATPPCPDLATEYLGLVEQEVDKCHQVTERLLKLSIPPPSHHELVCVDRVVDDNLRLLHWEASSAGVTIQRDFAPGPLRILGTDSELRMATLNLCQNALHAMPQGGVLSVALGRDTGRVVLRFADTGTGIPPSDLQRIFEPFFSRRADGVRGTGLGLAITKEIVERFDGAITIESVLGQGTQVTLFFPDAATALEV
jgi:signal transduction histidine kinase/HAMP domain-containing protein